ncbi:MAG: sulfatase-like hydrolase/transferase, partial [Sedimentisphaerales bacterium]|nr:sulfatase-like hydrolase/transferase [Sedimentisphaerales bacterium]
MCSPSRSTIFTGQDFFRLEGAASNWGTIDAKFALYPDILAAHGYHCGSTGKTWGPGNYLVGGRSMMPGHPAYNNYNIPEDQRIVEDWPLDYAKNFEDFLSKRSQPDQPFSFWYGCTCPHRPYKVGSGLKAGKKLEDVEVPGCLPDNEGIRTELLDYALEIDWFDTHLGRMMAHLEKIGELDNTIIVITSDNGMPFIHAKGFCFDSGTRVPLAIRWPEKIKAGRVISDFVNLKDMAPTFLEAAGVDVPEDMSGKSLINVFESRKNGRIDPKRDFVITGRERFNPWMDCFPQRAIRTDDFLYIKNYHPERKCETDGIYDWKYVMDRKDDPKYNKLYKAYQDIKPAEELYDVKNDTWQMENLAENPKYKKIKEDMARRMQKELVRLKDPRAMGKGELFESYMIYSWNFDEQRPKTPQEDLKEYIKPEDRIATPEEIRKMQGKNFGRRESEK